MNNDQLLLQAAQDVVRAINNLTAAMQAFFPQATDTTASSATGGAASLPANPTEFLNVTVGGQAKKIPLYDP